STPLLRRFSSGNEAYGAARMVKSKKRSLGLLAVPSSASKSRSSCFASSCQSSLPGSQVVNTAFFSRYLSRPMNSRLSAVPRDARREALQRWLADELQGARVTLESASEDASFRRYWRVLRGDGKTFIAMDAPPDKEDCRPFVHVASLLRDAGVHAPQVHAQ